MISGRCYCGHTTLSAGTAPLSVTCCHCVDCRRITGAPMACFAAYAAGAVAFLPSPGREMSLVPGVRRWGCPDCGSPLAAEFDYLPGQVFIPLGLIDQADDLKPALHSHDHARLAWLKLDDGVPRIAGTSRDALNAAGD